MRHTRLVYNFLCHSSRKKDRAIISKLKLPPVLEKYFWYDKIFFFEKNLVSSSMPISAKISIKVRLVTSNDSQKILRNFPHLSAKEIKNRWNLGHLCLGAEAYGEIVNLRWISFNEAYVGGLKRKLWVYPNSAYLYDEYTLPEYRGLGIAPAAFSETLKYLKVNTPVEKVYICISHTNYPSLRAAKKEELHRIGGVSCIHIFNLRHYRFEGETAAHIKELKGLLTN